MRNIAFLLPFCIFFLVGCSAGRPPAWDPYRNPVIQRDFHEWIDDQEGLRQDLMNEANRKAMRNHDAYQRYMEKRNDVRLFANEQYNEMRTRRIKHYCKSVSACTYLIDP